MSTNQHKHKNKRVTKQVRLSLETHQLLKLGAIKENMVMSKFLDQILKHHFESRKQDENLPNTTFYGQN